MKFDKNNSKFVSKNTSFSNIHKPSDLDSSEESQDKAKFDSKGKFDNNNSIITASSIYVNI